MEACARCASVEEEASSSRSLPRAGPADSESAPEDVVAAEREKLERYRRELVALEG